MRAPTQSTWSGQAGGRDKGEREGGREGGRKDTYHFFSAPSSLLLRVPPTLQWSQLMAAGRSKPSNIPGPHTQPGHWQ